MKYRRIVIGLLANYENASIDFYDASGNFYYFNGVQLELYYKTITDVEEKGDNYKLWQNYPNPFNLSTTLCYSIVNDGLVQLNVYDILGKKVAELVNEKQSKGVYMLNFNAKGLSSGVYFYKLSSAGFTETKKLILIK